MLGFQSGWWRKRLCVNSMSLVDVVAKKSVASSGGRSSYGHLLGSQFCVWCRVSFFKVFLSLFLHLSRGPSHYPVSCQYPARTHCPGAPSLAAHRDTGLRALQQTIHGLVVFSISTVVFLQNSKESSQRVHLSICKDFSLKLFELNDSTVGFQTVFSFSFPVPFKLSDMGREVSSLNCWWHRDFIDHLIQILL